MDQTNPEPVISVRDLVVGFSDHVVLNHLSLDVRRGEILGLVGASGGGKSVLLRTIIGLIAKQAGEIALFGVDTDAASPEAMRGDRAALGHPVSTRRAVFLFERASERRIPDA